MIGLQALARGPNVRSRINNGLSINQGTPGSLYLTIDEDTPLRCTAHLADGGLVTHQYESTYEVDSKRADAKHALVALYAKRREQRQAMRMALRLEKHRLLAEFRESCWYEVPRFYYRKVVEFRSRPVYALRGVYVTYRVTRKKLVRKIPYKRKVVWYTTIVHLRHRGIVRKKRRHEKVVTLYKRIWRIWTETHRRKWGKERYLVRMKTYKVSRRIKTPLPPRRVFDIERFRSYLSYQLNVDLQSSSIIQEWMAQINATNSEIQKLQLYAEKLPFSDNRCRFVNRSTLLESTSPDLINRHRYLATFGRVAMPVCTGPDTVTVPWVNQYTWRVGPHQPFAIQAYDLSSGEIVKEGFPGHSSNPTSFVYRGFGRQRSLQVNQAPLGALYPHDGEMPSVDINDPLIYAKTHGAMWASAQALLNGHINGPEDPFVLTRSVAELKDIDQTARTFREAITWASVQDTSSKAYQRLIALERHWQAGKHLSAKDLAYLKRLSNGRIKLPRGTLIYAAGLYCCYRFALEPTVSDILTVADDWKKALFGIRSNLAKMLGSLDIDHLSQITLRKSYRPDLRARDINAPRLPADREVLGRFHIEGSDDVDDGFLCDLYLNDTLIEHIEEDGTPTFTADGSEIFQDLRSRGRIVTFYHESIRGLVYHHFDRDTLAALIGENIRDWRDAVSQTLERARLLETIWELIPLSFIVDWFLTTGNAVSNLHNLVMTWYSGTYESSSRLWATQLIDRIMTTSLTSAMNVSQVDYQVSRPIEIRLYDTSADYARGRYSRVGVAYTDCICKIKSHEYFPLALQTENSFKIRTFYRGPYDASSDTLGTIASLIPVPKVHMNLGKLASLTAVLTGILLGRNGRKSVPR